MAKPMKWAVIEMAGMAHGERVVHECASWSAADSWTVKHYPQDERERLHVDIAHWDEEGEFWSYDH